MVSSVEPEATRAGVAMLARGGNAIDAATAVAYTLAVTHPSAGNLGGGGFLLYRPRGGPTVVIDFREQAPRALTQALFDAMIRKGGSGAAAVAIPGTVAGLELGRSRFGKLSRDDVMAPAIDLSRKGFRLTARQAARIRGAWSSLQHDPQARRIFGAGRAPKGEGATLVQGELADTLDAIRVRGAPGFYEGPVAKALSSLSTRGGLVTEGDLAAYVAHLREPLSRPYRGYTVEVPPPPSAGGVAVQMLLALSERSEAHRLSPLSVEEAHLFAELSRRVHALRRFEVGDPASLPDVDFSLELSRWLDPARVLAAGPPIDPARATPSKDVHALFPSAMKELEHTTHFSAVDAEGNVASCTTTLSASFGARVVAAGVVLNNSLAAFGTVGRNTPAPGRFMTTSMSPALVLANGDPVLVTGSPGGDTIPSTVVRVIRNVLDYGMPLDVAVDAPRLHHGFVPDEIRYEAGRPPSPSLLAALRARGHRIAAPTRTLGDANSVLIVEKTFHGYADPREGGIAASP
jgi:gamma-glutamyltranspeptidase/glutathione hydrolase